MFCFKFLINFLSNFSKMLVSRRDPFHVHTHPFRAQMCQHLGAQAPLGQNLSGFGHGGRQRPPGRSTARRAERTVEGSTAPWPPRPWGPWPLTLILAGPSARPARRGRRPRLTYCPLRGQAAFGCPACGRPLRGNHNNITFRFQI